MSHHRRDEVLKYAINAAQLYRNRLDELPPGDQGWAIRQLVEHVDFYIGDLETSNVAGIDPPVPLPVKRAVYLKFLPDGIQFAESMVHLIRREDVMECWSFTFGGVFYGIEEDGYIHT